MAGGCCLEPFFLLFAFCGKCCGGEECAEDAWSECWLRGVVDGDGCTYNNATADIRLCTLVLPPGESLWVYTLLASCLLGRSGINPCQEDQPQLQLTCAKNLVKLGHVIFEIYEQTGIQTFIAILCTPTRGKVICYTVRFHHQENMDKI